MSTAMKAAVVREVGKIGVEEIDRPAPGPGEVLVRVAAAGVCHTDVTALGGGLPVPLPAVLGHEGSGVVAGVGPGVSTVASGDHVVLSITYGCRSCFQCHQSAYGLCETGTPHLMAGTMPDGTRRLHKSSEPIHTFLFQSSFAEYAVVPAACAVKVRQDAPLEVAALLACGASTGYGAVTQRAKVVPGSSVLVIGAGGVGLSVVMAARLAGATTIVVSDMSSDALALAEALGATHAIDVSDENTNIIDEATRITGGRGVDYAFDAVGAPGTVESAFHSTRNGGEVVAIGASSLFLTVTIPLFPLIYQKRLTGTNNGSIRPHIDIPNALDAFMAGQFPLDRLITRRYDLDEIETALSDVSGNPGRGVIIFPGAA